MEIDCCLGVIKHPYEVVSLLELVDELLRDQWFVVSLVLKNVVETQCRSDDSSGLSLLSETEAGSVVEVRWRNSLSYLPHGRIVIVKVFEVSGKLHWVNLI